MQHHYFCFTDAPRIIRRELEPCEVDIPECRRSKPRQAVYNSIMVSAPLTRPRPFDSASLRRATQSRRNSFTTPRNSGGFVAIGGGKKVCTEDRKKTKTCARIECGANREHCTGNCPDCQEACPNDLGVRSFTHITHR